MGGEGDKVKLFKHVASLTGRARRDEPWMVGSAVNLPSADYERVASNCSDLGVFFPSMPVN